VPLLMSLICLKGHDNGRRFLVISLISYLLLIILSSAVSGSWLVSFLILLIVSPFLATSSIRRIHDAGFATPFAIAPVIIYYFNVFGFAIIEDSSRWALLLLAFIATVVMAVISNARTRHNHHYIMGYHGPIKLQEQPQQPHQSARIEPTIVAQRLANAEHAKQVELAESRSKDDPDLNLSSQHNDEARLTTGPHRAAAPSSETNTWEQQVGSWLADNKKLSFAVAGILVFLSLLLILQPSTTNTDNADKTTVKEDNSPATQVKSRLNKIEFSDNFWLILDENDAATIAWEGNFNTDGTYWSAATGKGDDACIDLHFSLGENFRTLQVTVKTGGDYYADFSPVDTQAIVQSIADKDRFKLCGYEFELKGTRTLLRKNRKYREYLGYSIN
jgi:hypothetical protein